MFILKMILYVINDINGYFVLDIYVLGDMWSILGKDLIFGIICFYL